MSSSSTTSEPVVARVARLADGEALASEPDLGGVELARRLHLALAVERRPVAGGGAREHGAGGLGRERADGERRLRPRRSRGRRPGEPEPLEQRDDRGGGEQDDGADREHLVGAVLRDEPERRRERARDAAGGRDREQAPGGAAEPRRCRARRAGRRSARPTPARRSSARRARSPRRAGRGAGRDPTSTTCSSTQSSTTGIASTSAGAERDRADEAGRATASGRRARPRASSRSRAR